MLSDRKHRRERSLCLVEGIRLTQEALSSGLTVNPLLFSPRRLSGTAAGRALRNQVEHLPAAEEIDDQLLASLSDTVTSQGIIAAVSIPDPLPIPAQGLALVLDGIADPGNAGTILRTARAAGAAGVIATRATTDLWSPKAMRGGMGAHFHMPVLVELDWARVRDAIGNRPLLLATASGGTPYWEVDWRRPTALIVGSEAHGATAQATAEASSRVTIPMAEGAESLNAAVAAAVLLFEVRRQALTSL